MCNIVDNRVVNETSAPQRSSGIDEIRIGSEPVTYNSNMEVMFKETDEIGFYQKRNYRVRFEDGWNGPTTAVVTAVIDTGF